MTEQFGIDKKEVVFVEDVWEGGGSFGSSLEFFVKGLELGNAVFTEFQGDLVQLQDIRSTNYRYGCRSRKICLAYNGNTNCV